MGMSDENEVDGGKVVVGESSVAEAADDEKPVGPVGIDENISVWTLNQKRGVANPGDTDLSCFELRKDRGKMLASAPLARKKSREDDIGDKAVWGPLLLS